MIFLVREDTALFLYPEIFHEPDRIRVIFETSDLFVGNEHARFREKDSHRKIGCIYRFDFFEYQHSFLLIRFIFRLF